MVKKKSLEARRATFRLTKSINLRKKKLKEEDNNTTAKATSRFYHLPYLILQTPYHIQISHDF